MQANVDTDTGGRPKGDSDRRERIYTEQNHIFRSMIDFCQEPTAVFLRAPLGIATDAKFLHKEPAFSDDILITRLIVLPQKAWRFRPSISPVGLPSDSKLFSPPVRRCQAILGVLLSTRLHNARTIRTGQCVRMRMSGEAFVLFIVAKRIADSSTMSAVDHVDIISQG